jgi:hypothetical protein
MGAFMSDTLTSLEADNIATLARHVLALIENSSPASRIEEAYDLLGSACEDYAKSLLFRVWKFHRRPELFAVGAAGVADFARSESMGIDSRLSAAPPETQKIIEAYLRERDSTCNP